MKEDLKFSRVPWRVLKEFLGTKLPACLFNKSSLTVGQMSGTGLDVVLGEADLPGFLLSLLPPEHLGRHLLYSYSLLLKESLEAAGT